MSGAPGPNYVLYPLSTDHIHDAISELERVQSHPDTSLCAAIALLYAHKCCDTIGECGCLVDWTPRGEKANSRDAGLQESLKKAPCTGNLDLL